MDALHETALLGTDKKALDTQALPESIKAMLNERHSDDAEFKFLEVNAYINFYQLAGQQPKRYTGPWNDEVIEEHKPIAPHDLLQLYSKFELTDYQIREALLNIWLNVLIDGDLIVSPALVNTLIQSGKNLSNATKSNIIKVIGNKGAWILQHDSSLNYAVAPLGEHVWLEGTTQERKLIFTSLRKVNAKESLNILQATWATESVTSKKMFLEIMQQTSVNSDLSFVEELYNTEFRYQRKEKKTEKECRRILSSILLRYSSTELYRSTTENLQNYFAKAKKGIIGMVTGRDRISFNLPESEDDFWNSQNMEQQYGLEVKNYDIALYKNANQYWLSYFLESLPMHFWSSAFDTDYKHIGQYWLDGDEYKTKISGEIVSIYQQSLINYIEHHRDHTAAAALVNLLDARFVVSLLSFLNPSDFEAYISSHDYYHDVDLLMHGSFHGDRSWSLAFSEKVISKAYDLAIQNKASSMLGKAIAQYSHQDSIAALYKYNEKAKETSGYHAWNTNIFQLVHAALEIRNKIHSYKNKTS